MEESEIIFELNRYYLDFISSRVIDELQDLKDRDFLLSGDDNGLKSVWEEICVQVQGEETIAWDAYENTIQNCISAELKLQPVAIYKLLSYMANMDDDQMGTEEDIIQKVLEQVRYKAADFTNENIERYQNGNYDEGEDRGEDELSL